MSSTKYPLFPLSAHLLPGGRMALRIFEPRYVRMVKEVCANDGYLVMCMLDAKGDKEKNQHIYPIGTLASVIDFDLLDDGLLGIKVAGLESVEVSNIVTQADGLRTAQCERLSSWHCDISPHRLSPIDDRLKEIFERYPDLAELYEEFHYNDPVWVMQRWLELLPVDAKQKQYFLKQADCKSLLSYLAALVQ